MDSWSKKRKLIYGLIGIFIVVVIIALPLYLLFYKSPTCFDGKKNGGEQGVDCGGKCTKLCQSEFIPATVAWARIENVVPGIYNAGAYIINPNNQGEAKDVPYTMSLFDNDGMLIVEVRGKVTIPPNRNTMAFSGLINVAKSIPKKVLFQFSQAPDWNKKADTLSSVVVVKKDYKEEGNNSSLIVGLRNDGLNILNNIGVYAILHDSDGNTIGFSKTKVDSILPKSAVDAPFTWNTNRQGKVVSIEVLYVAE
jgi:hypothetical protein